MKKIKEILDNYKDYKTPLEDRFGRRLCDFLTVEEMLKIGFEFNDDESKQNHKPIEFTYDNVVKQLVKDAEFGKWKAEDERGISSSLMYHVVKSWLKVLCDNGIEINDGYSDYALSFFNNVLNKYKKD